jgi:hypothetical protein
VRHAFAHLTFWSDVQSVNFLRRISGAPRHIDFNGRLLKRAPTKKRMKQPAAPAVETVAVEVIEQPAPGVITVTEVEETELHKVG